MKDKKKYTLATIVALVCICFSSFGQGLINNGAYIVNNGAYIYIDVAGLGGFTNQNAGASPGWVVNTGTIGLWGNWTNNSTANVFTANTGTVEMLGSVQTLGGTLTTWFNNLTLLGTGNKTLLIAETVGGGYAAPAGVLSLNDRALILNAKKLTVTNPLNTAITRTTGYIVSEHNVANSLSIVQWNVGATNAAYLFPFGTLAAPNYIPLTITKTGGSTNIIASTRLTATSNNTPWTTPVTQMWSATIPGAGEIPVVIDRWWDIKSAAAFTGGVTFTYRGIENTTTYAPSGTFAAQNWNGVNWLPPVGVGPGVLAGTASVTIPAQALGGSTLFPWVLSNVTAPLPIELLTFDAALNENKTVDILWSTASEINSDYFEIEKSVDGKYFESFVREEAAHNTTTLRNYKSSDKNPYSGISYYRLKETDYDGKSTYSDIRSINNTEGKNNFEFIFASLNESAQLTIGFNINARENCTITIQDVLGKEIFKSAIKSEEGFNKNIFAVGNLSGSVYFVRITNGEKQFTKKVIGY